MFWNKKNKKNKINKNFLLEFTETINKIVQHNKNVNEGYLINFVEIDSEGNVFGKDYTINIPERLNGSLCVDEKGIKFINS